MDFESDPGANRTQKENSILQHCRRLFVIVSINDLESKEWERGVGHANSR